MAQVTLRSWSGFSVPHSTPGGGVTGHSISAVSPLVEKEIVLAGGLKAEKFIEIANNTNVLSAMTFGAAGDLPDFDFLWVVTSGTSVYMQLVVDDFGASGEETATFKLTQNNPFVLYGDKALAAYTVDFAAFVEKPIERISFRNESGTTVEVRILAYT